MSQSPGPGTFWPVLQPLPTTWPGPQASPLHFPPWLTGLPSSGKASEQDFLPHFGIPSAVLGYLGTGLQALARCFCHLSHFREEETDSLEVSTLPRPPSTTPSLPDTAPATPKHGRGQAGWRLKAWIRNPDPVTKETLIQHSPWKGASAVPERSLP